MSVSDADENVCLLLFIVKLVRLNKKCRLNQSLVVFSLISLIIINNSCFLSWGSALLRDCGHFYSQCLACIDLSILAPTRRGE